METVLEILKYILPAFITFGATYFVMQKFLDNEHRKQMLLFRKESQKEITPLRLQAFERVILFLERTALDKLILRIYSVEVCYESEGTYGDCQADACGDDSCRAGEKL